MRNVMPGIGVINNPRSKRNRLHPDNIPKLAYLLGEQGVSEVTPSFEALESSLREFKARDIDILAINGGDGSNHITLTKLIEVYGDKPLPKVALLRGGTLNTISDGFGIKGKPEYLLYNISEKYAANQPFTIKKADLMNVNGKYGFLFGNGLIANFMDTYYSTGIPSPIHGVKTLFKGIASGIVGGSLAKAWFKPLRAAVTVDGEALGITEFSSMLAGTMKDIGVGFKTWARAFSHPGTFHVLFFTCSPFQIVKEVPFFYFARPIHPKTGEERVASCVTIEAEESFKYTLDGDMYTCDDGKMTIRTGPEIEIIIQ